MPRIPLFKSRDNDINNSYMCLLQLLNSFIEFNIRDKMENYYLKWQCMQTFMHFGTIVVPTSVLSDKQ